MIAWGVLQLATDFIDRLVTGRSVDNYRGNAKFAPFPRFYGTDLVPKIDVSHHFRESWLRGVLSEGYGHGGPGVCLGYGQTEAGGVPSVCPYN